MNYKNAFRCENCPECNNENGCPCWTEIIETNIVTGEERLTKACLFSIFPRIVVELIKASNRPAAAVESTRNEIVRGFECLTEAVKNHKKMIETSFSPSQTSSL